MTHELDILPMSSHVAAIVPIPLDKAGRPAVPSAGAAAAELADLVEPLKETQVRSRRQHALGCSSSVSTLACSCAEAQLR